MAIMSKKKDRTGGKASQTKAAPPAQAEGGKSPAAGSRLTVFDDLDTLFEDFLHRRWPGPLAMRWPEWPDVGGMFGKRVPSIDIADKDGELIVRAELPGVDRKDLDVSVVDRTLTIRGTQREEKEQKEKDFYRKEIRSGTFSRSVLLPVDVDPDKARATCRDGVVELRLPKLSRSSRRRIPLD